MTESNLKQIGERLADLRDIFGYSAAEMAEALNETEENYLQCEKGERDIPISFLYKAAKKLHVDVTDLIMGETPKLSMYHVVKHGEGLPVERRVGFSYQNMAYLFKERKVEPFIVVAPYSESAQNQPIAMSVHEGHEFDMILKGTMKFAVNGKIEILHAGDSIYLNSKWPHGMIAIDGEDCEFLAVVIPDSTK